MKRSQRLAIRAPQIGIPREAIAYADIEWLLSNLVIGVRYPDRLVILLIAVALADFF